MLRIVLLPLECVRSRERQRFSSLPAFASVLLTLPNSALQSSTKRLPNSLILAAGTPSIKHTFQLPGPPPRAAKKARETGRRRPEKQGEHARRR